VRGTSTQTGPGTSGGRTKPFPITGTISNVDEENGRISLKSDGAESITDLKYPTADLANLNVGDRVTAEISLAKGTPAGGTPSTGGSGGGGAH
jgi:hypothetical protein